VDKNRKMIPEGFDMKHFRYKEYQLNTH